MRINQKILSIPPYISTSWKNVLSLHVDDRREGAVLIIGLMNGSTIEIPGLDRKILEAAFEAHEKYLEQETIQSPTQKNPPSGPLLPPEVLGESSAILSLPIRFGLDGNMGNLLQHNPEAADSPNLPPEVLEKIMSLSKAIGLDNLDQFPKPEPHCNCMHCQIMKALQGKDQEEDSYSPEEEEVVSEEDLRFRDWDVQQKGDQLYIVTNPLNREEHYDVFLGSPIGCTCGQENCEHIKAVLNS